MIKNIEETIEQAPEYDVSKTMKYLYQMIDIANMFPMYELFGDEVTDYEIPLHLYHSDKTGKVFELDPYDDSVIEVLETITEVWAVIKNEYPKIAEYVAVEAYNSVIGEEVFEESPSDEFYMDVLGEAFNEEFPEEVVNVEKLLEVLKKYPFLSNCKPEVVKLQNFVRLTRIAHNMRYLAYQLHKRKNPSPPIQMTIAYRVDWRDIFYHIPGREEVKHHPFRIISKYQNNKETGKLQINPSFMERVLSEIDILQIKICGYCYKIFFAEPRNMKYCSSKCNNRIKSKRYDQKKKRLASSEIPDEYVRAREALEYLEKKKEQRERDQLSKKYFN